MAIRSEDTTSLTLLSRVQAQEADAWQRLVELYAPLVHHWCRRGGLSEDDTADVFQEVFRSVSQKINDFRRDREGDTFRGWLKTITANKIRDHYRKQQKQKAEAEGGTVAQQRMAEVADPLAEPLDALAEADEAAETAIMQQTVRRALEWIRGDFEPRTWDAFWKTQVEERIPQDVADELGMTAAAVRKAKYRVLRRLREELDGLVEG